MAGENDQKVVVTVKPALKSRLAWLLGVSAVLWIVSLAGQEALSLGYELPRALLLALKVVGLLSAVAGFVVRLSMPDLVSGIPWLDKSTANSLVRGSGEKEG